MIITNRDIMEFVYEKWWNRSERMKKNGEKKTEKEKVCTTSFVQNEVQVKFFLQMEFFTKWLTNTNT